MSLNPERLAERCGRRTAELLTDDVRVLVVGPIDATLHWVFRATPALVPVRVEPDHPFSNIEHAPNIETADVTALIAGAVVNTDGAARVDPNVAAAISACAALDIPRYLLAPAGPIETQDTNVPAAHINAIITSRGIYRPAMVSRHHQTGEAPLDVIPLG